MNERKNDQNVLWLQRNSHNDNFCVLAAFKEPQCVLAFEKIPLCEICVVAVEENDSAM
jgi:hypothetical protein